MAPTKASQDPRGAAEQAGRHTGDGFEDTLAPMGYFRPDRKPLQGDKTQQDHPDDDRCRMLVDPGEDLRADRRTDQHGDDQRPEAADNADRVGPVKRLVAVGQQNRRGGQRDRDMRRQHNGDQRNGDDRQAEPDGALGQAGQQVGEPDNQNRDEIRRKAAVILIEGGTAINRLGIAGVEIYIFRPAPPTGRFEPETGCGGKVT